MRYKIRLMVNKNVYPQWLTFTVLAVILTTTVYNRQQCKSTIKKILLCKKKEQKKIKTIPDNYTSVTPLIISPSSAGLIEFLQKAFGAIEIPHSRLKNEHDVIIHVVVKIGDATVMLFDSREGRPSSPSF